MVEHGSVKDPAIRIPVNFYQTVISLELNG